jgi:hypothetical protein
VRTAFAASLQRTLWFQVGVFLLSFLLMLALPAGSGRRPAAGTTAAVATGAGRAAGAGREGSEGTPASREITSV